MIRVESIKIEEFRGIRELTLDLKGKTFAVCGPNGTGKSGIVDAVEFALTGNISRLTGEGTDNLSVKDHAPHVDSRNAPAKARVTLTATIPKLNKTVTIVRSVGAVSSPVISPSDPETVAVLKQLERHPEFVLTRRELIRYVLSPAGKRAKEVQALLRLDRVEQARALFQKIANKYQKAATLGKENQGRARENLIRALAISQFSSQEILRAANAQREVLGLEPIQELTATTSLKDGLLSGGSLRVSSWRLPKAQAMADLAQLGADMAECESPETVEQRAEIVERLTALASEESLLDGMTTERFLRTGLSLIDGPNCPFCDADWDPAQLRTHIRAKLASFEEVARQRAALEAKIRPFVGQLARLRDGLDAAARYGTQAGATDGLEAVREWRTSTEASIQQLERFLPLPQTVAALDSVARFPAEGLRALEAIERLVASVPEPSRQDAARDFLTVGQERLEAYREASLTLKKAEADAKHTRNVLQTYANVSTEVLEGLYKKVEAGFADLYREINREDEAGFTARLTPSLGKLGFDVDFYGRGHFPPGAYHSEGHQDAMGLCLYLALMRHLLGSEFTFAVLDDVLMSVDAGHRREVCSLLKTQFPETQFILTTHDPIWLRHMKTDGLLAQKASVQFRTWHVDHGPTEWDDRDVWEEIDGYLTQNDVRAAAALLRYFLEYIGAELCHRLRAPVEFRGDALYQLGDILPQATARLRRLYDRGKEAATSWGQADVAKTVTLSAATFAKLVEKSNVEQWQINPAVHYNEWATLQDERLHAGSSSVQGLDRGISMFPVPWVPSRGSGAREAGNTAVRL